ncbi:MAG: UPF0182 family protein [Steroidobacteraceae bacterium]
MRSLVLGLVYRRELTVNKLPVSGRTWVNEKLMYTHGYGVAMTAVNGFTPEGLPKLVLKNMSVESQDAGRRRDRKPSALIQAAGRDFADYQRLAAAARRRGQEARGAEAHARDASEQQAVTAGGTRRFGYRLCFCT